MSSNVNQVTISEDEYNSLLEDSRWLECLNAAGVDNWNGVDYAREILNEWDAEDEAAKAKSE